MHIWTHTGRRPVLAAGDSNGDIEKLDFTQHPNKPSLRLLVLHDDAEREFDYASGSERALDRAAESGWTVVSIKDGWATVFWSSGSSAVSHLELSSATSVTPAANELRWRS